MSEIISRAAARVLGLKRFFTGDACKKGHVEERNVSNGLCLACGREDAKNKYQKDILAARVRARSYYSRNRERRLALHKKWRTKYPEKTHASDKRKYDADPESWKARRRAKRAANPARARLVDRNRYAKNPSPKLESVKLWASKNPEKIRANQQNMRAARRGANGKITKQDIDILHVLQNDKCAYCKIELKKSGRHVDHIIPIAKGGSNMKNNLQLLCPSCNLRKNMRDPIDFAREIGLLV